MARRKPLHTLCALFGLVMACQPGTAETAADVEEVILTADSPIATFEVTLCMTGGAPNGLNLYSSFRANTSTDGEAVELTIESLDPPNEAYSYAETTTASSMAQATSIALDTQRDWEGSEDRRCQEQEVEISVPSLPAGQTVTITDITIELRAEWAGICGETPDEDSLSIEAIRL